ncbi:MAG: hypothetical protein GKS00_10630 [Alphaproteobacteria bacterium]|nr:hypothetical protein [Alphaproteobacteria bacterium]
MTRVATLAQNRFSLFTALNTQQRLFDSQTQVGTGLKSQDFAGLGRDAGRLVSVKSEFARVDQFIENIETTDRRLEFMGFSLDRIEELGREFRISLLGAKNGDAANVIGLASLAQGLLDQVVDLLNVRDENRFLFSGGEIRSAPVDLNNGVYTPPVVPPFPAAADTNWYGGDNVIQRARVDEGFEINYGIRANEPSIEKVIRAFDAISEITFSTPTSAAEVTAIDDAVALLTEALDTPAVGEKTIGGLFAQSELQRAAIGDLKTKHENFSAFAEQSIAKIEQVDSAEAISILNAEQVTLEASFTAIARIQRLSLVNFL